MTLSKMKVDYTLYLVTDSGMVPESSSFLKQVEDSINSGATIVQLREKSLSTLEFIKRAEQVHKLTQKQGIPLIINDRVDVALAVNAEGVHVGQDDMPAAIARKLIGDDKILGVTCSNVTEVQEVVEQGIADYVGLGTVYKTNTKKDVTDPEGTGPSGIRRMLRVLQKHNSKSGAKKIQSVAIGGINHSNVRNVMFQCAVPGEKINGVAVVSCIMANENAAEATLLLSQLISSAPYGYEPYEELQYLDDYQHSLKQLSSSSPMIHHITNNVVKNFSANVTLAIGASPIMSEFDEEFNELASTPNTALVLNLGTPSKEMMKIFKNSIIAHQSRNPIVFDPVGCGASKGRLKCCRQLLDTGYFAVIKGNVGEILALRKLTSSYRESQSKSYMRGVDSISNLTEEEIIEIGKDVSIEFKAVVVITGPTNYIIEGEDKVVKVEGGNKLMGSITGSGCALGSTIAAFVSSQARSPQGPNNFYAAVHAVKLYNKAGAAVSEKTPGKFMASFIDELYKLTHS